MAAEQTQHDVERDTEPEPPAVIGGYSVVRRLGGGGMGSVYEAEEPNIGRKVAVKILRRRFADDPEFADRFRNEARLSASVQHPAIVDAFAFGRLDDGRPYFVMPLLEGDSVRERLRARGKLSPAQAWSVARETASALAAAHAKGMVHRDLKPDNVFLERTAAGERTRVMDFGIAKSLTGSAHPEAPRTQTGILMGTPAYMAPEQWWGAKVDARVDQYALGVMLFEMLGGEPPFDPHHESGVMRLHLHAAPPSLESTGTVTSPEVERLLARLLAKEPGDRFPDMTEVIAEGDAAFATLSPGGEASGERTLAYAATLAQRTAPPHQSGEDAALGDAVTVTVHGAPASTAVSARRAWRRWLAAHWVVTVVSLAVLAAVGYAGEERHQPLSWFVNAGFLAWPIVFFALGGVLLLPALGRGGPGRHRAALRVMVLAPAVTGAVATYLNWDVVIRVVSTLEATKRFRVFNMGAFEAGTTRFMGFGLAMGLALSLAALQGTGAQAGGPGGPATSNRLPLAFTAGVVVLGVAAALVGAPGAVLVCTVAAGVLALPALFRVVGGDTAAQIERSVFGMLAVLFATGAALERVGAREAVLWSEQASRGARITEILAAASERDATTAIVLAVVAAVVALEATRLRAVGAVRALRAHAALVVLLVAGIGADVFFARRFHAVRDASREALEGQFALFAELDPPSTSALDDPGFEPREGPALQITRTVVAVNGQEVSRLASVATPVGRGRVENALFEALARASAAPLSCLIDRSVPWSSVQELLAIAHAAGARETEVLFTRGATPIIPRTGPPEATYVESKDFAAVRVVLDEKGVRLDGARPFGQLAEGLVADATIGKSIALDVASVPAPGRPGESPR